MNDGKIVGSVKASYSQNGVMHNTETYAGIASTSYWKENYEDEPLAAILMMDSYIPSAGGRGLSMWMPREDMPFATEWTEAPKKATVETIKYKKALSMSLPLFDILKHIELESGRVDGTWDANEFKRLVLLETKDTTDHDSGEESAGCTSCEADSSGSREKGTDSSPCQGA